MHRYVVTAYDFNHVARPREIDPRLIGDPGAIFYCVDPDRPTFAPGARIIYEQDIDPRLGPLGREHIAEWTFFIAEYRHAIARYPFFVISSRFYEKNARLPGALPDFDHLLAPALDQYGFAYLPSYDRDGVFEDLQEYFSLGRLGMIQDGLDYAEQKFGLKFLDQYRYFSDFMCNYIGFRSRADFEAYFETMSLILDDFVAPDLTVTASYDGIVKRRDVFRSEKPLTLFLELCSHAHFYRHALKFAGLKYDGLYEIDERHARARQLAKLPVE